MYYKADWSEARERIEAWWRGDVVDRVAISVYAPRAEPIPGHPYPSPVSPEQAWTDVSYRLEAVEAYCCHTYFGGEEYPRLNPSMGPGTLALFLGARPTWMMDTVWFDTVLDDLSEATALSYDLDNQWWRLCQRLVSEGMRRGRDRYLVVLPDLIENLDTLASLHGIEELLIALVEHQEAVRRAQQRIVSLYSEYYDCLFELANGPVLGSGFHLHAPWAPGRMAKVQCDIGVMISPRQFEELAFPYYVQQCERLDYVIWHLDGRANLRHLDCILELPNIHAIQWVPGAGDLPEASREWFPLYRRIRSAGKSLELSVEIGEVEPMVRELGPEGLLLRTAAETEQEAKQLLREARSWTKS
jgi:5-methyltetrahydrofolate--homocysteine methyltransferase